MSLRYEILFTLFMLWLTLTMTLLVLMTRSGIRNIIHITSVKRTQKISSVLKHHVDIRRCCVCLNDKCKKDGSYLCYNQLKSQSLVHDSVCAVCIMKIDLCPLCRSCSMVVVI